MYCKQIVSDMDTKIIEDKHQNTKNNLVYEHFQTWLYI